MGQAPQLTFRKMTMDDVETVAEIEFKSFSLPWTLEDFWHEVLNKDSESIVAEIDGKVVVEYMPKAEWEKQERAAGRM